MQGDSGSGAAFYDASHPFDLVEVQDERHCQYETLNTEMLRAFVCEVDSHVYLHSDSRRHDLPELDSRDVRGVMDICKIHRPVDVARLGVHGKLKCAPSEILPVSNRKLDTFQA